MWKRNQTLADGVAGYGGEVDAVDFDGAMVDLEKTKESGDEGTFPTDNTLVEKR